MAPSISVQPTRVPSGTPLFSETSSQVVPNNIANDAAQQSVS